MKYILAILFFSLSLFIVSCDSSDNSKTNQSEVDLLDDLAVDHSISQEEKNITIQKMNIYIDCINSASAIIESSFHKYTSWADLKDGPGEKVENVKGISDVQMAYLEPCIKNIEVGNQLNVLPEFDEISKSYIESLKKAQEVIHEAFLYYSTKQYFDDVLVTGREIHPKLVAAYKYFFDMDKLVRQEISNARYDLSLSYIASLKEKKDTFSFLKEVSMLRADKLMEVALMKSNEFKFDKFKMNLDKFEKSFNEYSSFLKKGNLDEKLDGLAKSYEKSMEAFIKSAKKMKEFKSGDLSLSDDELALKQNGGSSMILGTPENLNLLSNKMISAYNDFVIQMSQEQNTEGNK